MKNKLFLFAVCVILSSFSSVYAQENEASQESVSATVENEKNVALNVGVMMGGGSLIGADLEYLVPKTQLGLQVGVGISSFGAGLNYHLKNKINSSFVSLQYYYQQFGDNHYASWLGPMFVYRAKKLFQAGIGLGGLVEKGPGWYRLSEEAQKVNVTLLFQVGVYF
ncbi:MAG: hypothetical protein LBC48_03450 [Dysgonamonadaceae bacterium]|jgi:hypothetical protein|nr:hypothetical protein [Dysgonamonadaceae bacterium]